MSNTTIDHKSAKADAKAAKAYAKATRPFFKKKRYWALASLAVIAIATISSRRRRPVLGAVDAAISADHAPKGATKDKAAPKPLAVQAKAILAEFDENEAAADAKYDGKVLKVTGSSTRWTPRFSTTPSTSSTSAPARTGTCLP